MWSASRSSTWAWEPVAWAQARPRWKRRFVSTWTPTTRTSRSSRLVASACAHSSPCWTFRCQASVVCHSCRFRPTTSPASSTACSLARSRPRTWWGSLARDRPNRGRTCPGWTSIPSSSRSCVGCWNSRASSIPAASRSTSRAADTRRSSKPSAARPARWCATSSRRADCAAVAAAAFSPAASGRWRSASRATRSTSSATPTKAIPAPSWTAR